jgi:Adenine specific DNA methylase Mod
MSDSLVEALPKIIKQGKREAQRILDGLSKKNRITLQTNELVLPSKDRSGLFRGQIKDINVNEWFNRLVYGDNLLAMQALLAGDNSSPSLRGKIDLIYIDPPYDSKADYRTKIQLPNVDIEQRPTVIEQFAYSDTWKDGTASYLQMMIPRLILMRELLSEQGSIYVHIDWHVGHYLKVVLDEIFGKDNFRNEIIWAYFAFKRSTARKFPQKHDVILSYAKNLDSAIWNTQYKPHKEEYLKRWKKDKNGRYYRDDVNPTKGGTRKIYLDELKGDIVDSLWDDIPPVNPMAKERVNYGTQKT